MHRSLQRSMQTVSRIIQKSRFSSNSGIFQRTSTRSGLVSLILLTLLTGCVTQGDFLSLQERVADYHKRDSKAPDPFARIAQLSSDVDVLRQKVRDLEGEVELARKDATDALAEVQRTRTTLAQGGTLESGTQTGGPGAAAGGGAAAAGAGVATGASGKNRAPEPDEELAGYQVALDARRTSDFDGCIEHFTAFLQAYPTSGYADDAAYWLADCTYQKEDYKRAVVRFNAVVSVYPESPKAPDALYRQGESLIKLGPKFHEAARTVFKRVQKDYPKSERATEAAGQLERLGSGTASK